jgi:hypothetical protein
MKFERVVAALMLAGCTCEEQQLPSVKVAPVMKKAPPAGPPITAPFTDDFNRAEIGPDWHNTADPPSAYKIVDGALVVAGAYNHPLWLNRRIPRDATIEFDCWSESPAGDLKVEAWGDGRSHSIDRVGQYTSTSYNFVFGGWNNQISTLARLHEHGGDRLARSDVKVVKGQRYHWTIKRDNGHIEWLIDGKPFFTLDDNVPLDGENHGFFAVTDWEAELHFDNLKITPKP